MGKSLFMLERQLDPNLLDAVKGLSLSKYTKLFEKRTPWYIHGAYQGVIASFSENFAYVMTPYAMFKCYESPVSTLTSKDSNFTTPHTRKVIHERKSHFQNPAKHLRWRYNRLSLLTSKNRRESWTLSK